jgi:hypothetical protein
MERGTVRVKHLFACAELDSSSPYPWETYAAVNRLPKRRQCRLSFDVDRELAKFKGADKLVAGAVKYAGLVTVVVCAPGFRPPPRVHQYAARRRVRLIELPSRVVADGWPYLQRCCAYEERVRTSPRKLDILRRYLPRLPGLSEAEVCDVM